VYRAEALLVVGRAHEALGDGSHAVAAWQEALDVATDAELAPERANAMRRLGMADFLAGRLSQASSRFAAAYRVTLDAGDRHGQAWALQNLAWVTTTRGDFAETDAVLGRAARLFAELGDPVGRSWLRGTTAFARLLAGRLQEARRLARIFLPFGERVGEGWAVGTLRAVEAYAASELGDLTEADREARRAYREFAAVNDDWGRGFALVVRGAIARGLAELDHAIDLFTDALEYAGRTGHPLLLGMAGTLRGFTHLQRGDVAAAEADARRVMIAVEPHNPLAPAQVGPRVLLAEAWLHGGEPAAAVALLAPIATDSDTSSMLLSRRHALSSYAAALLAEGRVEAAQIWSERAREAPAGSRRTPARGCCGRGAERSGNAAGSRRWPTSFVSRSACPGTRSPRSPARWPRNACASRPTGCPGTGRRRASTSTGCWCCSGTASRRSTRWGRPRWPTGSRPVPARRVRASRSRSPACSPRSPRRRRCW
jgi:tetratricopeptide (TPR) repeat protein